VSPHIVCAVWGTLCALDVRGRACCRVCRSGCCNMCVAAHEICVLYRFVDERRWVAGPQNALSQLFACLFVCFKENVKLCCVGEHNKPAVYRPWRTRPGVCRDQAQGPNARCICERVCQGSLYRQWIVLENSGRKVQPLWRSPSFLNLHVTRRGQAKLWWLNLIDTNHYYTMNGHGGRFWETMICLADARRHYASHSQNNWCCFCWKPS